MYERGGLRLLLVIFVVSNVPDMELLRYYLSRKKWITPFSIPYLELQLAHSSPNQEGIVNVIQALYIDEQKRRRPGMLPQ